MIPLFYLSIDPARQILEWVRAGHEPAICYDPAANDFLELSGSGLALGVDKQCKYEINRKEDLYRGSIIVMGTDGIWETRNESGQMFGRTAIYDIIRDKFYLESLGNISCQSCLKLSIDR
jgi:sigma-B regulation protein RsbU (phosphoserine phosphatase)